MPDHEVTPSESAVGTLPPSLRGTPSSPLATIDSGAEIRIRGAIGQGGRGVEVGPAEFPIAKISHDVMFDTAFRDPVLMVRPHSARPTVADRTVGRRSNEAAATNWPARHFRRKCRYAIESTWPDVRRTRRKVWTETEPRSGAERPGSRSTPDREGAKRTWIPNSCSR
jgi:hypothetical protein